MCGQVLPDIWRLNLDQQRTIPDPMKPRPRAWWRVRLYPTSELPPTPSGALEPLPDFKIEVGIGSSAPEGVGQETLEGAMFALTRSAPPVCERVALRADLCEVFFLLASRPELRTGKTS